MISSHLSYDLLSESQLLFVYFKTNMLRLCNYRCLIHLIFYMDNLLNKFYKMTDSNYKDESEIEATKGYSFEW